MKKITIFLIIVISLFTPTVFATNKKIIKLKKCVDGDTAEFIIDKTTKKVRFLAINTPEIASSNKPKGEPYGKEASKYTCDKLTKAKKIEIEYDPKSDKLDKYGRVLGWIFVDDKLLQNQLVKNGYAEIKYVYGDYSYLDTLKKSETEAKNKKLRIWSTNKLEKEENEGILDKVENFLIKFVRKIVKSVKNML